MSHYLAVLALVSVREMTMADKGSLQALADTLGNLSVLDALTDPISIQDREFRILYQNQSHKDLIGDKVGEFCYRAVHGREQPCTRCHLAMCFEDGKSHTFEQSRTTADGTTYFEIAGSPLKDKKGRIIAGIEVVRNISRRKKMHEKLKTVALTDELTGLFNRRGFLTLAEQQRKVANRSKKGMSLLYLDLDGMKAINDELGHDAGDQALTDTAAILKDSFRESDIIARMGGDEFAVLLAEPSEEKVEHILVNHIEDSLKKFNKKSKRDYELLLSMGVAHYDPENQCSIDDLMKQADELMYEDKRLHKIGNDVYSLSKKEVIEKRSFHRFRTEKFHIRLDTVGKVNIQDISVGGVRIETPKMLLPKNEHIIKEISGSNEKTDIKAIVVWTSRVNSGAENPASESYEAGLKFAGLNDRQEQTIASIIAGLSG